MNGRLAASLLAASLAGSRAAAAHDFWIEPSSFHPAVGSRLSVGLRVGEHFEGDPVPRADSRIVKFIVASSSGERPIGGLPGTDPAGFLGIDAAGPAVIGYRSSRSPITLEPEKFEKYLADEGLDGVLARRAEMGAKEKPGREVYSRCAKALIAAGGERGSGFDRVLGFTLEIVPLDDPSRLRRGAMRLRVLYEGRPLSGALVKAISAEEKGKTLSTRSDAKGGVSFALSRRGIWLIKAVHMIPAPAETDADWESLWASLTFEVP